MKKKKIINVKIVNMFFILIFILVLISCSFSTAIYVINNTNYTLQVECKTIYDDQVYSVY